LILAAGLVARVQKEGSSGSHRILLKGDDRVDADGIPLYILIYWQKAHFLDQMNCARTFISLPPIGIGYLGGTPAKKPVLGSAPGNAAFCE
jgi:hypothetical protein